jgi:N-methylhydantoinase A
MRVGVEVGGTFTDLVAVQGDQILVAKVPSTPESPDIGAFASLAAAALSLPEITDLAHGSTVATNAVLERKGARIAFVTTKGFRDILALQRHDRRRIYDLNYQKPKPVVERRDCFEVLERITHDGAVLIRLDEGGVGRELIPALRDGQYDAVAVCLLGSYANPAHEQRLAQLIADALPGLLVTCSSDVVREFREFERASTTSLSAYVQPVIDRYLGNFARKLEQGGFAGRFSVMQSNGGRLPAQGLRKNAIRALFSGPAAGVVGAIRQVARSGFDDLITFDMGGTSTDVCLVERGKPSLAAETEIDGLPVRTPVLDIVTVGAGGGSLIWIDDGGMLRVGPQSAGADPGPACYGKGGLRPTITDAHVARGSIRPHAFLGGHMPLDAEAARHSLEEAAGQLRMSVEELADSALRVADANIVRAIQLVSTERGRDPREYALVPFGGAGPLHAAKVAEDLGVTTIVIPPNPGVISAFGLLASDFGLFDSVTRKTLVDAAASAVAREVFGEMRVRAIRNFETLGLTNNLSFTYAMDMRFVGQAFEVPVEVSESDIDGLGEERLIGLFDDAHRRMFFHGITPGKRVEIVAFRLGISKPLDAIPPLREDRSGAATATQGTVFDNRVQLSCQMLPASALRLNQAIEGPTLIESFTATTYIPVGWRATLDQQDNIIVRRVAT